MTDQQETTQTSGSKATSTEADRVRAARESFSGRLLTNRQFKEAVAVTRILEAEIQRSGTFKEKLGDYAYAFARTERFDAMKGETILRDLFKERTGQSMNEMRKAFVESEEALTDDHRAQAYRRAAGIEGMMEAGDKLGFTRAAAHQAEALAREIGITDACAMRVMAEAFEAARDIAFRDWGKELDERIYRPQIDAEKQTRKRSRTRGGSDPEDRQNGQTDDPQGDLIGRTRTDAPRRAARTRQPSP
ncbi:hypothetical protein [Stappia sp.]|uniref:hypothetical protein n=1 Tax=Stappia sp. TaxID=1870903 RepID=UPI003C799234